jgi:hypothetical protein
MPRRIGSKGMGTCSRTPLNIVYSSCAPFTSSVFDVRDFPFPPRTASGPPLGVVGRRAGSSGAVGVGRHYSIWKGLYGPYAALARNLSSGHRCRLARTGR